MYGILGLDGDDRQRTANLDSKNICKHLNEATCQHINTNLLDIVKEYE